MTRMRKQLYYRHCVEIEKAVAVDEDVEVVGVAIVEKMDFVLRDWTA